MTEDLLFERLQAKGWSEYDEVSVKRKRLKALLERLNSALARAHKASVSIQEEKSFLYYLLHTHSRRLPYRYEVFVICHRTVVSHAWEKERRKGMGGGKHFVREIAEILGNSPNPADRTIAGKLGFVLKAPATGPLPTKGGELDFRPEATSSLAPYGRDTLIDQIEAHLSNPDSQAYFVIVGSPGTGKTYLIRLLIERRRKYNYPVPYFFIGTPPDLAVDRRYLHYGERTRPSRIMTSLARQILKAANVTTELPIPANDGHAVEILQETLSVYESVRSHLQLVVFLDGLDETDNNPYNEFPIAKRLAELDIPSSVKFVLTSRVSSSLRAIATRFDINLDIHPNQNESVSQFYSEVLVPVCSSLRVPEELDALVDRTQGSFLYAHLLTTNTHEREILPSELTVSATWNGLSAYLDVEWERLFQGPLPNETTNKLLATLVATDEPLCVSELAQVLEIPVETASGFIDAHQPLLRVSNAPDTNDAFERIIHGYCHPAIRDYIAARLSASSVKSAHNAIGLALQKTIHDNPLSASSHTIDRITQHLQSAANWRELVAFMSNPTLSEALSRDAEGPTLAPVAFSRALLAAAMLGDFPAFLRLMLAGSTHDLCVQLPRASLCAALGEETRATAIYKTLKPHDQASEWLRLQYLKETNAITSKALTNLEQPTASEGVNSTFNILTFPIDMLVLVPMERLANPHRTRGVKSPRTRIERALLLKVATAEFPFAPHYLAQYVELTGDGAAFLVRCLLHTDQRACIGVVEADEGECLVDLSEDELTQMGRTFGFEQVLVLLNWSSYCTDPERVSVLLTLLKPYIDEEVKATSEDRLLSESILLIRTVLTRTPASRAFENIADWRLRILLLEALPGIIDPRREVMSFLAACNDNVYSGGHYVAARLIALLRSRSSGDDDIDAETIMALAAKCELEKTPRAGTVPNLAHLLRLPASTVGSKLFCRSHIWQCEMFDLLAKETTPLKRIAMIRALKPDLNSQEGGIVKSALHESQYSEEFDSDAESHLKLLIDACEWMIQSEEFETRACCSPNLILRLIPHMVPMAGSDTIPAKKLAEKVLSGLRHSHVWPNCLNVLATCFYESSPASIGDEIRRVERDAFRPAFELYPIRESVARQAAREYFELCAFKCGLSAVSKCLQEYVDELLTVVFKGNAEDLYRWIGQSSANGNRFAPDLADDDEFARSVAEVNGRIRLLALEHLFLAQPRLALSELKRNYASNWVERLASFEIAAFCTGYEELAVQDWAEALSIFRVVATDELPSVTVTQAMWSILVGLAIAYPGAEERISRARSLLREIGRVQLQRSEDSALREFVSHALLRHLSSARPAAIKQVSGCMELDGLKSHMAEIMKRSTALESRELFRTLLHVADSSNFANGSLLAALSTEYCRKANEGLLRVLQFALPYCPAEERDLFFLEFLDENATESKLPEVEKCIALMDSRTCSLIARAIGVAQCQELTDTERAFYLREVLDAALCQSIDRESLHRLLLASTKLLERVGLDTAETIVNVILRVCENPIVSEYNADTVKHSLILYLVRKHPELASQVALKLKQVRAYGTLVSVLAKKNRPMAVAFGRQCTDELGLNGYFDFHDAALRNCPEYYAALLSPGWEYAPHVDPSVCIAISRAIDASGGNLLKALEVLSHLELEPTVYQAAYLNIAKRCVDAEEEGVLRAVVDRSDGVLVQAVSEAICGDCGEKLPKLCVELLETYLGPDSMHYFSVDCASYDASDRKRLTALATGYLRSFEPEAHKLDPNVPLSCIPWALADAEEAEVYSWLAWCVRFAFSERRQWIGCFVDNLFRVSTNPDKFLQDCVAAMQK